MGAQQVVQKPGNGNGVWKWIAGFIAAPLVAGTAFYLVGWRQMVTRADLETAIARNSPYAIERGVILLRLERLEKAQDSIDAKLDLILEQLERR